MSREKTPKLEKVLSSSGRIRILSLLSRVEELHLTEIAKRTEQSFSATQRHLKDLAGASLVEERDFGRVRIFKLRLDNPRARMLRDLILKWNHDDADQRGVAQA